MNSKKNLSILIVMAAFVLLLQGANLQAAQVSPEVFVSSDKLLQADTLLVVVKNYPGPVTGRLGGVKLRFSRSESGTDWVAIVGIPVGKRPGIYQLIVGQAGFPSLPTAWSTGLPEKPAAFIFKKDITVLSGKFPTRPLAISASLKQQGYTAKKIVTTIIKKENVLLNSILNTINSEALFKKPFDYPLDDIKVVGPYGEIRVSGGYSIQHLGADLRAPLGTPVKAVNDGKVVFIRSMPDYGNTVVIDHGLGIYSLYLHLSEFKVTEGQMVSRGDTIALSGSTGYALGPHLHFSIKMRGASVNPLKFIQATQVTW